jgi:alanyl-tRNA synthetase
MALFGEKYGDEVRVVSMGDWSKELCGGTHVDSTGEIGSLIVVSETGIGAGIRRIEAVAGAAAYAFVTDLRQLLADTAETLDTQPRNLVTRAQQLVHQVRAQDKRLEALTGQLARREAESLLESAIPVNGMVVIARQVAADTPEYLQVASDAVKSRIERGIVVLATVVAGNQPTPWLSPQAFGKRVTAPTIFCAARLGSVRAEPVVRRSLPKGWRRRDEGR